MDDKDKKIQELTQEILTSREEITPLREENRLLKEQLDQLDRLLGLDSETSSKPPSSDGLRKKPRPMSLRTKGKNPSGGQLGHKGSTLLQVAHLDFVEVHGPETCGGCGQSLEITAGEVAIKRQVFDIPPQCLEVTEPHGVRKVCACGYATMGVFPENVRAPVQYGKKLRTWIVYLMNEHFIPEDRLQNLMKDMFKAPIATDTLTSTNKRFMKAVNPFQKAVLEQA